MKSRLLSCPPVSIAFKKLFLFKHQICGAGVVFLSMGNCTVWLCIITNELWVSPRAAYEFLEGGYNET